MWAFPNKVIFIVTIIMIITMNMNMIMIMIMIIIIIIIIIIITKQEIQDILSILSHFSHVHGNIKYMDYLSVHDQVMQQYFNHHLVITICFLKAHLFIYALSNL